MTTQTQKLPYGIGRLSAGWIFASLILVALIALGIYAYSRQLVEGLLVTGLRDIGTMAGAPWGLYIAFDIYFVGVSFAGITIAAMIRLLNLKHLTPVSRMAELLTIVALLAAGMVIMPDLGQPLRGFINLFRYARPASPFFGTFTLVVSGYLFSSLVYFYLDGRRDAAILAKVPSRLQWFYRLWAAGYNDTPDERTRHEKTTFWLAVAILPLLVVAHSTLGFVFGLQVGRPGWFGALQGPAFVVMAGISGIGMLLIIAATLRRVLGLEEQLKPEIFKWLGSIMMVLIVAYLYFMVTEWLTGTYAAHNAEVRVMISLLTGEYSWLFWGSVAALVLALAVQLMPYFPLPDALESPAVQHRFARLARLTGTAALTLGIVWAIQVIPVPNQAMLGLSPTLSSGLPWAMAILVLLFFFFYTPIMWQNIYASSVVSGVLVNLAAIGKRILIVVPSQTQGTLLPYKSGSYAPTWVEYSIIIGLFAFGILLYAVVTKAFPILEVEDLAKEDKPLPKTASKRGLSTRALLVWGIVMVGFALQAVSYFFLAAPLGISTNESFSNPRMPYASALFIVGVMVVFLAAVIYELLPDKDAK